jgi:hypothetical protein
MEQSELGAAQREETDGPRIASCDQEALIMHRIQAAIRMAKAIEEAYRCRADDSMRDHAIKGLIEGAAIEIIHTLGMEPEWVNLRRIRTDLPW